MNKKKTRKSKAAKSMRDLPEKTLNAKTAGGVKGGMTFKTVKVEYKAQDQKGSPPIQK